MAEDSHSEDSPQQGGVFGNLPDTRPGTRSPRRNSGKGANAGKKPAPARKATARKPAAAPKPAAARRPAAAAPDEPADAPVATADEAPPGIAARAEPGGGIEDLAWAGVAAAAEAATLGVRLASRAIDALRGNTERD